MSARAEVNFAWVSGDKRCNVIGSHGMCYYVTRKSRDMHYNSSCPHMQQTEYFKEENTIYQLRKSFKNLDDLQTGRIVEEVIVTLIRTAVNHDFGSLKLLINIYID